MVTVQLLVKPLLSKLVVVQFFWTWCWNWNCWIDFSYRGNFWVASYFIFYAALAFNSKYVKNAQRFFYEMLHFVWLISYLENLPLLVYYNCWIYNLYKLRLNFSINWFNYVNRTLFLLSKTELKIFSLFFYKKNVLSQFAFSFFSQKI